MDYCDWIASYLGKTPMTIDWKDVPSEAVDDPTRTEVSFT